MSPSRDLPGLDPVFIGKFMKVRSLMRGGFALSLLLSGIAQASPVGVELVADIDAEIGSKSSDPQRFVRIGDAVYFAATEPETGTELYVSENGATAARRVVDLASGTASSSPTALGRIGNRLLLSGNDGLRGMQIWSIDLTTGERTRLTSEAWSEYGAFATARGEVAGRLLIELGSPLRLWLSDGTVAGTKDLDIGSFGAGQLTPLCALGDQFVFLRPTTFGSDYDIVASDGTPGDARVLLRIEGASFPRAFHDGNHCYFTSSASNGSGWKIWRSDGTLAGTQLFGNSGATSSVSLADSVVSGGQVYVLEYAWQTSQLRFRRVGDEQPLLAAPHTTSAMPALRVAGNRLVFLVPGGAESDRLWVSDGSAAGTHAVTPPAEIPSFYNVTIQSSGTRHVIVLVSGGSWIFDAETESWTSLGGIPRRLHEGDFAVRNGIFHFAGNDALGTEVWRSDGSTTGTQRLHDVWAASRDGLGSFVDVPSAVTADRATLLFAPARDADAPGTWIRRLWRTNGSAAGTSSLDTAAYDGGHVVAISAFGQGAVFTSQGPGPDMQRTLFATDAALTGAAPIDADVGYSAPYPIKPGGGVLFQCPGTSGNAICSLLPGATQALPILTALPSDSLFAPLASYGNAALFFIYDFGSSVRGLWRSDGTIPGTYRVAADLRPIDGLSHASLIHDGKLAFGACGVASNSCGLHISDGSAAGTQRILTFDGNVAGLASLAGRIAVLRRTTGTQLLLGDATGAPPQILSTIDASGATAFAALPQRVHFLVNTNLGEVKYYVSDGTTNGTRAVAMPGSLRPLFADPIVLDADTVVFHCTSPATGDELCAIDAAATQVRLIRDFFPGTGDSDAVLHGTLANGLYFGLDDGRHGRELWRVFPQPDLIFAHGFGQGAKH